MEARVYQVQASSIEEACSQLQEAVREEDLAREAAARLDQSLRNKRAKLGESDRTQTRGEWIEIAAHDGQIHKGRLISETKKYIFEEASTHIRVAVEAPEDNPKPYDRSGVGDSHKKLRNQRICQALRAEHI